MEGEAFDRRWGAMCGGAMMFVVLGSLLNSAALALDVTNKLYFHRPGQITTAEWVCALTGFFFGWWVSRRK